MPTLGDKFISYFPSANVFHGKLLHNMEDFLVGGVLPVNMEGLVGKLSFSLANNEGRLRS